MLEERVATVEHRLGGVVLLGVVVGPQSVEQRVGAGLSIVQLCIDAHRQLTRAFPQAKGHWEAYARSQGATDAELEGVTKEDLVTTYGG